MKAICPHCHQHYDVDTEFNGQKVECLYCHQTFLVKGLLFAPSGETKSPEAKGKYKWYHFVFVVFGFFCLFCGFCTMIYAYEPGYGFHSDRCNMIAIWLCAGVFIGGAPFCTKW